MGEKNEQYEDITNEENIYADIIIDISHEALDRVFQYRVPEILRTKIRPGDRVVVPFGKSNRETEGYVIGFTETPDYDADKIKDILRVNGEGICVESELIRTAFFLKEQYGSTMIRALRTVMPVKQKVRRKESVAVSLRLEKEEAQSLFSEWERKHYRARARLLARLIEKGEITKEEAVKECGVPLKEIRRLEEQGILKLSSRLYYRNPFSGDVKGKEPGRGAALLLNEEQQAAVDSFRELLDRKESRTCLLYGVTGSGKTEVYLCMIEEVLKEGRQAIVLIPEISLTYQTVRRFYERFGERIAVLNSRMSRGERFDACERIRAGEADVVIGPRSALFAPVKNLGLIVIDEEHDGAYKSDTTPKYHARETAIYRASLTDAPVVLGSATPSVETYAKALSGEYILWTLKKRAGNAALPQTEIVDLREEFKSGNRSMFSRRLKEGIRERLTKKEQVMLFLNRRGFAGFVSCRACGSALKCPHCDVSLTLHRNKKLYCHYCGYETAFPALCPVCKSPHVASFGLGTEKVEAALYQEFPGARILRMDMDTTRKKHAHEEMMAAFSRGEADILVGTQMIVKGHDYANVTLVGILAADLSLHEQDFRSGEKTFDLLCQAAGRAGRGDKPGEVIIQTYSPEHYAIKTAAAQSYDEFFKEEYAYRKLMEYPPCSHLLVILVQSASESDALLAMLRIEKMIEQSQQKEEHPVQILNPGQASLAKLRDIYRQVLYLKDKDPERLLDLKRRLEPVLEKHPLFAGISIQFDFDPISSY